MSHKLIIRDKASGDDKVYYSEEYLIQQKNIAFSNGRREGLYQGRKESSINLQDAEPRKLYEFSYKDIAIDFHNWMMKNDTEENAEEFFGYTDQDMFNAFIKEKSPEN